MSRWPQSANLSTTLHQKPRRLKLGFLSRVYGRVFAPTIYQDTLELFSAAEALGFDAGWVAQHHFGMESGWLPSPLVLLAAAAQRTQRIEIGTGVIVLPFEQPLRLAEDAAVLDAMSNGRLHLGLGSGFDPDVFHAFGQDIADKRTRFAASFETLKVALSGQLLAGDNILQPPSGTLTERLWHATSNVEQAAKNGAGLILAPAIAANSVTKTALNRGTEATSGVAAYRAAWDSQRADSGRVAIVRAVFPDVDRATASARLAPDVLRYVQRMQTIRGVQEADSVGIDTYLERLGILYGNTQEITANLQQDGEIAQADYLIVQVQTESTTLKQALRNLEIVAADIAPALGWCPAISPASVSTPAAIEQEHQEKLCLR